MPNTKPVTTVTTGRRGRPASANRKAENLIGVAGCQALKDADLFIVPGSLARELALYVGEPLPASAPSPGPRRDPFDVESNQVPSELRNVNIN